MKVLVAVDGFVDKLTSHEAAQYIEEGITDAEVISVPLFDGYNGLIEGVLAWQDGKKYSWTVLDSHLNEAQVTLAGIDETLFIDCAQLFNSSVESSSSYGLGQLLQGGLDIGYEKFVISFGQGKVYDGGIGCLAALGAEFFDFDGNKLSGALSSDDIKRVRSVRMNIDDRLEKSDITVISDKEFYLFGKNSQIAKADVTQETMQTIDNQLWYFNEQLKKAGIDLTQHKNGGSAGGLVGLFAALGAHIMTSKELIYRDTFIEELLTAADVIIFGGASFDIEGSLVASAIMDRVQPGKDYIYLTAGRQLQKAQTDVIHLNVYPEITRNTESMHIGMQLQNSVQAIWQLLQK